MKAKSSAILLWTAIFAVSMGYLESAVVVYLREIYYPEGFAFPLKMPVGEIAMAEVIRELATMIMLFTIGMLTGRTNLERFGVFIFAFGIWDIFYYVFLKLLIGWPENILTWDILFLIPVTWVGPVLAPVINAMTMVIFGGLIIHLTEKKFTIKIRPVEWALLCAGSLIIIFSYIQDYLGFMLEQIPLGDLFSLPVPENVNSASESYVPEYFNWWIYGIGQGILILAVVSWFLQGSRGAGRLSK